MILFSRFFSSIATVLACLLAFLFGWRLDAWLSCADIPAVRERIVSWKRRASCYHRPGFAGGVMIDAKAA